MSFTECPGVMRCTPRLVERNLAFSCRAGVERSAAYFSPRGRPVAGLAPLTGAGALPPLRVLAAALPEVDCLDAGFLADCTPWPVVDFALPALWPAVGFALAA